MSSFRVYFYSIATRKELTGHSANGKTWLGTGGNLRNEAGEFVRGTTDDVVVADYADLGRVVGRREVTSADFDEPVAVKIWYPGEGNEKGGSEWRKLLPAGTIIPGRGKSPSAYTRLQHKQAAF